MRDQEIEGFRFRGTTRAPYEVEARFRFDREGDWLSAWISDISLEGMFVRTDEPRPPGTLVEFDFQDPSGARVGGLGTVVWMRAESVDLEKFRGMGLQFRYIDAESRQSIYDIVTEHLENCGKRTDDLPAGLGLLEDLPDVIADAPTSFDPLGPAPGDSAPRQGASVLTEIESLGADDDTPAPATARPFRDSDPPERPSPEEPFAAAALGSSEALGRAPTSEPPPSAPPPTQPPRAAPPPAPDFSDSWVVAQEAFKPPGGRPAVARSRLRGSGLWVVALLLVAAVTVALFWSRRDAFTGLGRAAPAPGVDRDVATPVDAPRAEDPFAAEVEALADTAPVPAGSEPAAAERALPVATRIVEVVEAQEATGSVVIVALDGRLADPGPVGIRLEDPPRYLVRLPGIGPPTSPLAVSSPQLRGVRTGEHREDGRPMLHMVFDLASPGVEGAVAVENGDTLVVRFEDV